MLQEIFLRHCERFSFFLIKGGNNGSMLWAAALPLVSTIHLLLSTAFSRFTLTDSPMRGKGKLPGDAAARGCRLQLRGRLIASTGSGSKNSSGLNSAKEKCNYRNCVSKFLFHSFSRRQSTEMQML